MLKRFDKLQLDNQRNGDGCAKTSPESRKLLTPTPTRRNLCCGARATRSLSDRATDADQVIVAHSKRQAGDGLPSFSYDCGSLENSDIRKSVCQILEGGERAFLERERRYRLRWDEDQSV